jgi:hypothetical protein
MAKDKFVAVKAADVFSVANWKSNKAMQFELQKALDLPVLKRAFATILTTAMPGASPLVEPGMSAEASMLQTNNLYHNRSGFTQFHRALHNLAKLPAGVTRALPSLEPEDE